MGCKYSRSKQKYFKRFNTIRPFVTNENVRQAESWREDFPLEEVKESHGETLIEFFLSEEDEQKIKEQGIVDENLIKTHLKARVSYHHTLLSLQDGVSLQYPIFYNDQMSVGNIRINYVPNDQGNWAGVTERDFSYEVDGLYYSDARVKTFSVYMPTLGTQVRISYDIVYENVNYLANLFAHESFPTESRRIIVRIPEWLDMKIKAKNTDAFKMNHSTTRPSFSDIAKYRRQFRRTANLDYNWDEAYIKRYRNGEKEGEYRYEVFDFSELGPRSRELAEAGATYNYPHLFFQINSYKNKKGEEVPVLGSVANLYAWYHQLVQRIGNEPAVVAEKAKSLIEGLNTDEDKLRAIFYWVQDNVRYIAYEDGIAGFKPEPCQMVFENRYGDCKGMANLLSEMLKSVGYDARLTWIGTRHIAYDYSEPSMAVDNHMICTVFLNGKKYFLDGTEEFIALNDYANRIQGRQVLIENGKDFLIDTIPNLPSSRNKTSFSGSFRVDQTSLVGKMTDHYSGERKTQLLRYFYGLKSERKANATERFLNRGNPSFVVSKLKQTFTGKREDDIVFDYALAIENRVIEQENALWVKLQVLELPLQFDVKRKRISDIDVGYKVNESHTYSLEIPQGWTVATLPDSVLFDNEDFKINLFYTQEKGRVVLHSNLVIHDGFIRGENRFVWEEAVLAMDEFYQRFITFKKN